MVLVLCSVSPDVLEMGINKGLILFGILSDFFEGTLDLVINVLAVFADGVRGDGKVDEVIEFARDFVFEVMVTVDFVDELQCLQKLFICTHKLYPLRNSIFNRLP